MSDVVTETVRFDPRPTRSECGACPRRGGVYVGAQIVPGAKILLVGEAPGEHEAETGLPFQGRSGKLLDGLLSKSGLDREGVSVANVCCCFEWGNRTPGADEIEACASLLEQTILEAAPEVIVALGGTAIARMVGERAVQKWQGSIERTPATVALGQKNVTGQIVEVKCPACKGKGFVNVKKADLPTVEMEHEEMRQTIILEMSISKRKTIPLVCTSCHETGMVEGLERFVSGARKGELKPRKVDVSLTQPEGRTVVLTFHPSALLDSGLAEYPLVLSALRRARKLAEKRPLIEVGASIVPYPQDAAMAGILLETTKEIVLDVETDGKYGPLTLVGLAPSEDYGVTFLPTPDLLNVLDKALAEKDRTLIGHNIGYDVKVVERAGVRRVQSRLWDTMHASFYADPALPEVIRPKALENVASRLRDYAYYNWKEAKRSGINASIFYYCASDCCWTRAIFDEKRGVLGTTGRLAHFEKNMMPALRTLIDVEMAGVQVDRARLTELHEKQVALVEALDAAWEQETGLAAQDRASTPKMRAYFYDRLGLERQFKGRGRKRVETLDEEACEKLLKKNPSILSLRLLISLRHADKILSTYLEPELDLRGRLHADTNLSGAITGRHSGDFQQIPRTSDKCEARVDGCVCGSVRTMFVMDDGDECLAIADKRQVEFKLWGLLSGDRKILGIFDQPDGDIHQWAADRFGVPRKVIKHVVHGGMFGAGAAKVALVTGMDVGKAQLFLDTLRADFARTFQWQAHQYQEAKRMGYITTRFGRRVPFRVTDGKLKETEVAAALVQSPAADMLNVDAWRVREAGLKVRWLLHDEIAISARTKDEAETLRQIVDLPYDELGWACSNDVHTGQTWAEAKP